MVKKSNKQGKESVHVRVVQEKRPAPRPIHAVVTYKEPDTPAKKATKKTRKPRKAEGPNPAESKHMEIVNDLNKQIVRGVMEILDRYHIAVQMKQTGKIWQATGRNTAGRVHVVEAKEMGPYSTPAEVRVLFKLLKEFGIK